MRLVSVLALAVLCASAFAKPPLQNANDREELKNIENRSEKIEYHDKPVLEASNREMEYLEEGVREVVEKDPLVPKEKKEVAIEHAVEQIKNGLEKSQMTNEQLVNVVEAESAKRNLTETTPAPTDRSYYYSYGYPYYSYGYPYYGGYYPSYYPGYGYRSCLYSYPYGYCRRRLYGAFAYYGGYHSYYRYPYYYYYRSEEDREMNVEEENTETDRSTEIEVPEERKMEDRKYGRHHSRHRHHHKYHHDYYPHKYYGKYHRYGKYYPYGKYHKYSYYPYGKDYYHKKYYYYPYSKHGKYYYSPYRVEMVEPTEDRVAVDNMKAASEQLTDAIGRSDVNAAIDRADEVIDNANRADNLNALNRADVEQIKERAEAVKQLVVQGENRDALAVAEDLEQRAEVVQKVASDRMDAVEVERSENVNEDRELENAESRMENEDRMSVVEIPEKEDREDPEPIV